ncbi:hypothetical protein FA15DRAFT_590673, partial [Coprinopsis marcescibilis]
WVKACNDHKIPITAKEAKEHVAGYRACQGQGSAQDDTPAMPIPEFSDETFINALVDFIVADDQSLNVVESVFFHQLLLLLRSELLDKDIPHRTSVRNHIKARWKEYLAQLSGELKHLANALLHIIDRLKIDCKIGWVTLDNTSNNDTMVEHLSRLLGNRGLSFSDFKHHIQCVLSTRSANDRWLKSYLIGASHISPILEARLCLLV